MNVQELSTALREHADRVEDIGAPARVEATRQRVVVVRRRRRAGVVAVAAAVIAVVAAGTLTVLQDPAPVQPTGHRPPAKLAGTTVKPRFDVADWHFHYVRGAQSHRGQRILDLALPASKSPRVLGWGVESTSLSEHVATLSVDGVAVEHAGTGEWTTGDVLAAGVPHHVSVTFRKLRPSNRAGIAVFDLVGRQPAGVSNGATTFREDIAGDHLLGARVGRPGEAEVSFDVTAPSTDLRFSTTCVGAPTRDEVRLSVNGHEMGGISCEQLPQLDPGPSGLSRGGDGWGAAYGIHPGATLHLTLRLVGHGNRPVDTSRVVLGAGVYQKAPAVARVAGWGVPALTEGPGGTYRYVRSVESRPGQGRLVVHLPASRDKRLVEFAARHAGRVLLFDATGHTPDRHESAGGGSSFGGGEVLRPGHSYTASLRIQKGRNARSVIGLVICRKVG